VFMGGDLFRVVLPASDGGTVTFQACAEDRNANLGCSVDQMYEVDGEPPTDTGDSSEGPVDPDSTGGGPNDTGTSDGGNPVTMTGATVTAGGTSAGGTDGETDTDTAGAGDDDGGGCGCRQQSAGGTWSWLALGLLGGIGLRRASLRLRRR
jgi:hypothetical protein